MLARDATHHNHMELLTIACIEKLPSTVVFVTDLSGTAGVKSTPSAQVNRQKVQIADDKMPNIER